MGEHQGVHFMSLRCTQREHHAPPEVWQRYGGAPRFLEVMGRGTTG